MEDKKKKKDDKKKKETSQKVAGSLVLHSKCHIIIFF